MVNIIKQDYISNLWCFSPRYAESVDNIIDSEMELCYLDFGSSQECFRQVHIGNPGSACIAANDWVIIESEKHRRNHRVKEIGKNLP